MAGPLYIPARSPLARAMRGPQEPRVPGPYSRSDLNSKRAYFGGGAFFEGDSDVTQETNKWGNRGLDNSVDNSLIASDTDLDWTGKTGVTLVFEYQHKDLTGSWSTLFSLSHDSYLAIAFCQKNNSQSRFELFVGTRFVNLVPDSGFFSEFENGDPHVIGFTFSTDNMGWELSMDGKHWGTSQAISTTIPSQSGRLSLGYVTNLSGRNYEGIYSNVFLMQQSASVAELNSYTANRGAALFEPINPAPFPIGVGEIPVVEIPTLSNIAATSITSSSTVPQIDLDFPP